MLAKIFTEQVKKNPEKLAVKSKGGELSYKALNQKANGIANKIIDFGAWKGKDSIMVGLLFEHGVHMVVGTIGAVKGGKTYVPLDPNYPEERLMYIIKHSGVSIIVTNYLNYGLASRMAQQVGGLLEILILEDLVEGEFSDPEIEIPGNQIAYLLYTSGSTGRPKGIIQTYENIYYFIKNYTKLLSITPDDHLTLFSAFSHDAAIVDIYAGLLNGATLYPLNIKEQSNLNNLVDWLKNEEITIYHSVPTLYRYFTQTLTGSENFSALRYIVLGGEEVIEHDVFLYRKLFKKNTVLVNLYGQSESSFNSAQLIDMETPFKKVTIGSPIPGTEFMVIDEDGEEVSELGVGEIIVLSDHVALGYWDNQEKTSEVFGNDPDLGRFYRTGDLGRLLLDGSIEFMGRKDFMVKIRGFRVEMGEIESLLLKRDEVKEVAVIAKEDSYGNRLLYAYIVTSYPVDITVLRKYLAEQLPDYMLPTRIISLDRLPVNPNGKVDRKALMEMELNLERKVRYCPPTNETEGKLAVILSEILDVAGVKVDDIGIDDNFLELGLHSLRAISFIARVYEELLVQVPLKEVFNNPTIRELGKWISTAVKSDYLVIEPVDPVNESDYYELSYSQKRLWYLKQINPEKVDYNIAGRIRLYEEVDVETIRLVLEKLVKRHESLRTYFVMLTEGVKQRIGEVEKFDLKHIDLSSLPSEEQKLKGEGIWQKESTHSFDLEKAPLIKVTLIKYAKEEFELLFVMHHIISDGWSLEILKREFYQYYDGLKKEVNFELEPLQIQYKDFAHWQNRLLEDEEKMKEVHDYWLKQLGGQLPILNLPTNYSRAGLKSQDSAAYRLVISGELKDKLKGLGRVHQASLFMVLLAAFNLLLARLTGQQDILIGIPAAGRVHGSLKKVIGFFINTMLLRNQLKPNESFGDFLQQIQMNTLQALEYQTYPVEQILEELNIKYPTISVFFNMLNMGDSTEQIITDLESYHMEEVHDTKFDILCYLVEYANGVEVRCHYLKGLFKRETIEYFMSEYIRILQAISIDSRKSIIEYISDRKKSRKVSFI